MVIDNFIFTNEIVDRSPEELEELQEKYKLECIPFLQVIPKV